MIAFLPIILKKAAREHGQKHYARSRRFWIMYAPIERPMINDVDPLVTFEKFRPFFLSLFFFCVSSMVTLLVIYSTFYFISFLLIYYSRSRTFLGEVLTISSDLLARTLMFHFFFFFFASCNSRLFIRSASILSRKALGEGGLVRLCATTYVLILLEICVWYTVTLTLRHYFLRNKSIIALINASVKSLRREIQICRRAQREREKLQREKWDNLKRKR